MRKLLIAAALIVAYVTPAFAEDFFVAVDLASGRCVMMSGKEPNSKHFKMMGKYGNDGSGAQGHEHDARLPLGFKATKASAVSGGRLRARFTL